MEWNRPGLVLAGILMASPLACPQSLPPDITARVDKVFASWDRPDSPGCALGVYQGGRIVYKRGYGMANLNDDVPITPNTVFHVASMSKQFTAASILLLAQQGKLSLDDDVHKYIPELPDFGERITLSNLLHHTSGLRDQWSLLDLAGWRYSQDLITDDDVMSVVTRQKDLNFKPGDQFMYSNTGYTLLAIIVKRVSGLSLREFTTRNIFEPLGMSHTHFRDDHEEIIKHDALGYEQDGKNKPFRMNLTNFDTVGATSLHTTVEDLQLWDENFYHPRVGGPELIQKMVERGKLNSGELQGYASGLSIGTYKGLPTVDHSGGDAGYRSDMTRFPDQHFTVAVLCNFADTDPTRLVRQVTDIVLAQNFKAPVTVPTDNSAQPVAVPWTAEQMTAIAGTYWNRKQDDFTTVRVKDGKLQIDVGQEDFHDLKPFAPGHFHVAGVPWGQGADLHFLSADAGQPRRMEWTSGGGKTEISEAVTPFEPTAAELAEYTGGFASEEIDPLYRISVQDGNLTLRRLKHDPSILHPAMRDVFVSEIGTVRFTRDANQHVSGFILDGGRVRNFQFTKKANSGENHAVPQLGAKSGP